MYPIGGVTDFSVIRNILGMALLEAPEVRVPEWQSLDVRDKPMGVTHEIQNAVFSTWIPEDQADTVVEVEPNIPWAEEHFLERVGGEPVNPPPSHVNWPFAQQGNAEHTKNEKFSHTYPERMWPKLAGKGHSNNHFGIRFPYGDLFDVVKQLVGSPQTRQAYLPIWFPEDTGAVHGGRVPCSLGYHFICREQRLHVTYMIRSCDFLRHFQDDVYMAMRLGQWVRDKICEMDERWNVGEGQGAYWLMGSLTMHMMSLHVFGADIPKLKREYGQQD